MTTKSHDSTELDLCRTAVDVLVKTKIIDLYVQLSLAAIAQGLDAITRGDKPSPEKLN